MKKRISDLLDGYEDGSVELSGGTPLSPARIKELTMNKITPKKNKLYRLPVRLLAAAAIVAALTASAMAVNYAIGAGGLMQGFFARDGGPLSTGQIENLDQVGQTFEEGVTDNGATITPIAALADENCYYLRLRIEAPEGTALPDSNPNDNIKEFVVQFANLSENGITLNDGVSKVLTIRGLWIQDPGKNYTPIFTGTFTFDIGLNFQSQAVELDADGLTWQHDLLDYTNTMQAMTLSPLSLSYRVDSTMPENDHIGAQVGALKIVLKDGSVFYSESTEYDEQLARYIQEENIALPLTGKPTGVFENYIVFDQPLDLSQVDYVQYGENKIPVNAG